MSSTLCHPSQSATLAGTDTCGSFLECLSRKMSPDRCDGHCGFRKHSNATPPMKNTNHDHTCMRASASSAESCMYPACDLSIPSQRLSQTSRLKECSNMQMVERDRGKEWHSIRSDSCDRDYCLNRRSTARGRSRHFELAPG